jgi:hypothetical protein
VVTNHIERGPQDRGLISDLEFIKRCSKSKEESGEHVIYLIKCSWQSYDEHDDDVVCFTYSLDEALRRVEYLREDIAERRLTMRKWHRSVGERRERRPNETFDYVGEHDKFIKSLAEAGPYCSVLMLKNIETEYSWQIEPCSDVPWVFHGDGRRHGTAGDQ